MSGHRVFFKNPVLPYLLILPQIIITVMFFFIPAFQALFQSFFIQDAFGLSSRFVLFRNYLALFQDRIYLQSMLTTFLLTIGISVITLSTGLLLAEMAHNVKRGRKAYMAILTLPYAVAPVAAAAIFLFMFNPSVGMISYYLKQIGINWAHTLNAVHAFLLVMLASSWKHIAYNFLFFTAALQNISPTIIEAAVIDGASHKQRFFSIVFPLLSPTTFFLLVMNFIYAFFETFGVIHYLTEGGPNRTTTTLTYKVYRDGFLSLDWGSSSAQSMILMIVVMGITLIKFRILEKKVMY